MVRLDYWHTMLPAMGSRKLTVKLREEGYPVGRKLVRRLMQEMGIWVIYPKANLSKRNFQVNTPPETVPLDRTNGALRPLKWCMVTAVMVH